MKSSPAKKAALNSVVAYCEMPPPTESTNTPWRIIPAGTNPLVIVRGPTNSLTESRWPGSMIAPRVSSEMRAMLSTRSWPGLKRVVNSPTTWMIPSDSAHSCPWGWGAGAAGSVITGWSSIIPVRSTSATAAWQHLKPASPPEILTAPASSKPMVAGSPLPPIPTKRLARVSAIRGSRPRCVSCCSPSRTMNCRRASSPMLSVSAVPSIWSQTPPAVMSLACTARAAAKATAIGSAGAMPRMGTSTATRSPMLVSTASSSLSASSSMSGTGTSVLRTGRKAPSTNSMRGVSGSV